MSPRKHAISLIRAMSARVEEFGTQAQELADMGHRHHARAERLQEEADAIEDAHSGLLTIIEDLEALDD